MTNPTPQQCREWIEYWSDKSLSFGCKTSHGIITSSFESQGEYSYAMEPSSTIWNGTRGEARARRYNRKDFEILGHPLTIGRVLDLAISRDDRGKLFLLWEMCGLLQTPINTILEEAKTKKQKTLIPEREDLPANTIFEVKYSFEEVLTGPAADLFTFLLEVLPVPNPKQ